MNKKLVVRVLAIIAIMVSLWLIYFEAIVPFAAKMNIPYRWQHIPLGQKRMAVHEFLGSPISNSNSWDIKGDEWSKRSNKNFVFLNVGYNADTVARRYRIGFVYNYWFGRRIYILKQDSI
jgi:hypothetical protein